MKLSPAVFLLFCMTCSSAFSQFTVQVEFPAECGEFVLLDQEQFTNKISELQPLPQESSSGVPGQEIGCKHQIHGKAAWDGGAYYKKLLVVPGSRFFIHKRAHHLKYYLQFWKKQNNEVLQPVADFRSKEAEVFFNAGEFSELKQDNFAEKNRLAKTQRQLIKNFIYKVLQEELLPRVKEILAYEEERFNKTNLFKSIDQTLLTPGLAERITATYAQINATILNYKKELPQEQVLFLLSEFPSLIHGIKANVHDPLRPFLCLLEHKKHKLKMIKRTKKAFSFCLSVAALGAFVAGTMGAGLGVVGPLVIAIGAVTSGAGGIDFAINMKERAGIVVRKNMAVTMLDLEKNIKRELLAAKTAYQALSSDPRFLHRQADIQLIMGYLDQLLTKKNTLLMSSERKTSLEHARYANVKNLINILFGGIKIISGGLYFAAAAPAVMSVPPAIANAFHLTDNVAVSFESEIISIVAQSLKNEKDKQDLLEIQGTN